MSVNQIESIQTIFTRISIQQISNIIASYRIARDENCRSFVFRDETIDDN